MAIAVAERDPHSRRDRYLNFFADGQCLGDVFPMQPHAFQVELDGFFHQLTRLFKRGSGCYAPRKVGNVRTVTVRGACIQNKVFHCFRPACFSIDACVLGSKSIDG